MGVRTAPVAGSGASPPRTAVVANSSAEKVIVGSNRNLPRNTKAAHHPRRSVHDWSFLCLGCQTPNVDKAPPGVHMAMVIRLVVDNILRHYPRSAGPVNRVRPRRLQPIGDEPSWCRTRPRTSERGLKLQSPRVPCCENPPPCSAGGDRNSWPGPRERAEMSDAPTTSYP